MTASPKLLRNQVILFVLSFSIFFPERVVGQSSDTWHSPYSGQEASGNFVLGLWHFDKDGEIPDASGRGHPAKLMGAAFHPQGKFGGCLECFPGWPVEDKRHAAVVAAHADLSPKGPFTIEMWLKPRADFAKYPSNVFLIDKRYVQHTDYQIVMSPPDPGGKRNVRATLGFGTDSETWTSNDMLFQVDRWHHLAVTYDARGTVHFFLDGRPMGNSNKPGRGGIAAGSHPLSIGDRLGSYYGGFPGFIDEVRLSSGVREFRPVVVSDISRRKCFVRGEPGAVLRFQLVNHCSRSLEKAKITIAVAEVSATLCLPKILDLPSLKAGESIQIEFPFPSWLRPDTYQVLVRTEIPAAQQGQKSGPDVQDENYVGEERFSLQLVPRPLPQRMPVVMWGLGGYDQVVKEIPRLKKIGFTHCLGLGADYNQIFQVKKPGPAVQKDLIEEGNRMLDQALANDLRIVVSLGPGHWAGTKPEWQRLDRKGQPYSRPNLANAFPELNDFFFNVGASVAQTWGDFPALEAALINTEVRDHTHLSFREPEREAFRKFAGFAMPVEATYHGGVDYTRLKDFPAQRIIADDHPLLVFFRWFWSVGDGWNGWHSAVHRGFHSTGRPDLWTFFDPAVRVPSLYGSGGDVDYLSHWTYTYPDPIRIGLCTDELLAMAPGARRNKAAKVPAKSTGTPIMDQPQSVMSMTQIIWYRSQTAPLGKPSDQAGKSPWEDYEADAAFITIPPIHLREALWCKLARPIKGIMYHGWQSLVPAEKTSYRFTHPETQHELARLVREVVEPLGPMLLQIPSISADVAMLESFTSQMFARRGTYGWGHSWAGDLWHALQYAHLQTDIIYEESILQEGLDRFKVLVLPDCDVLPQSVADRILAFQKRGGILIGDERTAPGIKPNIVLPVYQRTKKALEDKQALMSLGEMIAQKLANSYHRQVECSNPGVIPRLRHAGDADYIFLVNDQREYGSYVGQHGLVMENGLPAETKLQFQKNKGKIYDLRRAREVRSTQNKNGKLSWDVHLGPGDGAVFLVCPKAIGAIQMEIAKSVKQGEKLPLVITVKDTSGQTINAVLPLRVEITDPDGRPAESSGYYGAGQGKLSIPLDIAPNDRTGIWQIRVDDLASGLSSSGYFRVKVL